MATEHYLSRLDLLRTLLVPRLLLSPLVANDTLILCAGRWQLRLWHTLLAAMLAALILHTFQIVFLGHRDQTFSGEQHLTPVNDDASILRAAGGSSDLATFWPKRAWFGDHHPVTPALHSLARNRPFRVAARPAFAVNNGKARYPAAGMR